MTWHQSRSFEGPTDCFGCSHCWLGSLLHCRIARLGWIHHRTFLRLHDRWKSRLPHRWFEISICRNEEGIKTILAPKWGRVIRWTIDGTNLRSCRSHLPKKPGGFSLLLGRSACLLSIRWWVSCGTGATGGLLRGRHRRSLWGSCWAGWCSTAGSSTRARHIWECE